MAQFIYQFLKENLPPIARPVVLEIGAHIGTDTARIISLLQREYTYVAFEPDPRNIMELKKLQARGLRFILAQFAVSSMDLPQTFYQSHGRGPGMAREFTDGSSLLKPTADNRPWINWTQTVVKSHRLDTACAAIGITHADLIWCDAQGAELSVILGGGGLLQATRWLYAECIENAKHYEGQPTLKQIMDALPYPEQWHILYRDQTDVLLENSGAQL